MNKSALVDFLKGASYFFGGAYDLYRPGGNLPQFDSQTDQGASNMTNTEKADKIVGLDAVDAARVATGNCQKIVEWARRGAYLAWLTENQSTAPSACEGITSMADRIACIDASRKPKFPNDGLPLGPWEVKSYMACVHDSQNNTVCQPLSGQHTNVASNRNIQSFIARCGSLSVRRILAACDDATLATWADRIEATEKAIKA